MHIKKLIEKLILEEIEGFNRGNSIYPKTIRDLEDLGNDIYKADPDAVYQRSLELDDQVRRDPVKALKDYGDVLLIIHNNPDLKVEDPIKKLVKRSLERNGFETNKNLINSIYKDAGYKVGDIFANLILFYDRSLLTPEQRDVQSDLKDWIREPEEGE